VKAPGSSPGSSSPHVRAAGDEIALNGRTSTGRLSKDTLALKDLKGRHAGYGRSGKDPTGVLSIEKLDPALGQLRLQPDQRWLTALHVRN